MFFGGLTIAINGFSMVFYGSGPLVKRCDGFNGSLWSNVVNNHVNATHLNLAEEVISAQSRIGFPVWSY